MSKNGKSAQVSRSDLSEQEKAEIRALHKTLEDFKVRLADEEVRHENTRASLLRSIGQASQSLIDRINGIGRARGIVGDDTSKWNFDVETMKYTKSL